MWTEEKVLELIECYKDKTVLWNPKNPLYYKKPLKLDAWREIGELLNADYNECKNKMISILSSYRREKAKVKNSEGTGKGSSEIYHSNWFAFEALSFLWDRDNPRKRIHSMITNDDQVEENMPSTSKRNEPISSPIPQKKAGKRLTEEKLETKKIEILSEALGVLRSATSQNEATLSSDDEYRHFANFIGSKLKTYPPNVRSRVEQALGEIIFKADQGFFNQNFITNPVQHQPQTLNYFQELPRPFQVIASEPEPSPTTSVHSLNSPESFILEELI